MAESNKMPFYSTSQICHTEFQLQKSKIKNQIELASAIRSYIIWRNKNQEHKIVQAL
jgi:hypothetical protein